MQITARIIAVEYGHLVFLCETVRRPMGYRGPAGKGRLMQPRHAHGQARHWVVPAHIDTCNPTRPSSSFTALLQRHVPETTVFVVKLAACIRGIGQASQLLVHADLAIDVAA